MLEERQRQFEREQLRQEDLEQENSSFDKGKSYTRAKPATLCLEGFRKVSDKVAAGEIRRLRTKLSAVQDENTSLKRDNTRAKEQTRDLHSEMSDLQSALRDQDRKDSNKKVNDAEARSSSDKQEQINDLKGKVKQLEARSANEREALSSERKRWGTTTLKLEEDLKAATSATPSNNNVDVAEIQRQRNDLSQRCKTSERAAECLTEKCEGLEFTLFKGKAEHKAVVEQIKKDHEAAFEQMKKEHELAIE